MVGLFRNQSTSIEPVAHCSCSPDPSKNPVEPGVDLPVDMVPTRIAIREERYYISADNRTDPSVAPWRDLLLANGFGSSAAFPIRIGEKVVGAMTFHASEPGFFSEEEVQLLIELTDDLSFALEMKEQEKKRNEMEERLAIIQFAVN